MKIYEGLAIGAAIVLICDYVLDTWGSTPIVQLTYPQGECVAVYSADPGHSCENRPDAYSVQWISPKLERK